MKLPYNIIRQINNSLKAEVFLFCFSITRHDMSLLQLCPLIVCLQPSSDSEESDSPEKKKASE